MKAIAAMSQNRVIGRANRIPWHLPADFEWFKRLTIGHVLVMGRRTFESIGRPLPGRETIVVSRSGFQFPGVRTVSDLALIDPRSDPRDFFLCGGAQVYAQGLPWCSDLYLTLVKRLVDGDTFFPPFEDRFELVAKLEDTPEFDILHYVNRVMARATRPNPISGLLSGPEGGQPASCGRERGPASHLPAGPT